MNKPRWNEKVRRNRYIARKVIAYRKRVNPVPMLSKKFGVSKVRIYRIARAWEENEKG